MNKLACITGASSGIGETFARELARRGYDLLITARREERLVALKHALEAAHGITVSYCRADLTTEDGIRTVEDALCGAAAVDMLINNAGFGLGGLFSEIETHKLVDMLVMHNIVPVRLTKAVVPAMKKRGSGTIINVASTAGFIPVPGSATYPATKAFLVSFSRALEKELRHYGIRVQALCPGFTYTGFHDTPAFANFKRTDLPGIMWMRADRVVRGSLAAAEKGRVVYIPGIVNKLLVACIDNPLFGPFIWHEMLKKKGLKT